MRIPDGSQFGQVAIQPPQGGVAKATDGGIGNALQGLGATLQNATTQQLNIEREKSDAATRAAQGLNLVRSTNALRDLHDQFAQDVTTGAVDPDKAQGDFEQAAGKIKDQALQAAPPEMQVTMDADLTSTTGSLQRSLNGAIIRRKATEVGGTIDAFGDEVDRGVMTTGPQWAAEKYKAMLEFTGDAAGISPDRQVKLAQSFSERVHASYMSQQASDAYQAGSTGDLAALQAKLDGPDGDALNPDARRVIGDKIFGYQKLILAQEQRAQDRADRAQKVRETAATQAVNQFEGLTMSGQYASQGTIDSLLATTSGTAQEAIARDLIGQQAAVTGFASKSAADRAAILNDARRPGATPGEGTTPQQGKLLARMEQVDSAATAAAKDNPWEAAQKYGAITDASTFDTSNPQSMLSTLASRMRDIGTVEDWVGHKVSPFQPQEATTIARVLRALPPAQIGEAMASMGAIINDPDRIGAFANQLDQKDRTLGLMMKVNDRTASGRTVAERMFLGDQGLRDKTIKADQSAQDGWRAQISDAVRGTLGSTAAENDVIDAAYLVRASFELPSATTPGFASPAKSNAAAVAMVIGQPMERDGVKTLLPRGMDEDALDAKLRLMTPAVLGAQATDGQVYVGGRTVPLNILHNRLTTFGLTYAGPGTYIPTRNNQLVTVDKAGTTPLLLKVQ